MRNGMGHYGPQIPELVEILIEQHEKVKLLTGDAWPLLKTSELRKMLSRLAAG